MSRLSLGMLAMALAAVIAAPAMAQTDAADATAAMLKSAAASIEAGRADQALRQLEGSLRSLGAQDLPEALLLVGKAHLSLAGSAGDEQAKTRHSRLGGLNCMRSAAFFPESPHAPEALFLAGRANQMIGNARAAGNAWTVVAQEYSGSPFAARARSALAELQR